MSTLFPRARFSKRSPRRSPNCFPASSSPCAWIALRKHYPWLSGGLDYFTGRLTQAPEDANFALAWVVKHARTREEQDKAYAALRAKCDILWAQLDALYFAYVEPGWPPPGAFQAKRIQPGRAGG